MKDGDLYLTVGDGPEKRLTKMPAGQHVRPNAVWFSPDGKRLAALRAIDAAEEPRKVTFVESSPKDQLQPKTISKIYVKPGDPIPVEMPMLFDVEAAKEIPVKNDLFATPYYGNDFLGWDADSSRFTIAYNQRGHQVYRVVAIDAKDGTAKAIINEEPKTFFDYAGKMFFHRCKSGDWIWMSERSGWNHLYLINGKTGEVKNAITTGDWCVRGVDRVDEAKGEVWFHCGGIDPEQDPYYVHYCRVKFDGTGLTRLTDGDGTHSLTYSPGGAYYVDTYSRVDLPPRSELRRAADGGKICDLVAADDSELVKAGWKTPERFSAKGRDGKTEIYGVVFRPTNFDPAKHYPVIEYIYAGPHSAFVPKSYRTYNQMQGLVELGFVVSQIDGMGTSHRSKAFHDVCWKNLGDAGFPDRILWHKAVAEKYSWYDISRVGIYGGSAGGQSSLGGMLFHPEFYKVCVSDCGCHDNRMDKIWWNELWMSYPVGPHYAEQSNVTNAKKLQGKLLLVVGEIDTNVDPASTMQVANALIKADKDFDLLVMTGTNHGAAESPYGRRRWMDFFVRHLLGVEPRR